MVVVGVVVLAAFVRHSHYLSEDIKLVLAFSASFSAAAARSLAVLFCFLLSFFFLFLSAFELG